DYEVQWQIDTLESGGKIQQATILFNPDTGETRAMRSKEDAHDYRYFPDPDLLPLDITPAMIEAVRATLPELPQTKQARYVNELGLSAYDASTLTSSYEIASYFEACLSDAKQSNAKQCANWIMGELARHLNDIKHYYNTSPITPAQLARLIILVDNGTISASAAKTVFRAMCDKQDTLHAVNSDLGYERHPHKAEVVDILIDELGLKQVSDSGVIEKIVDEVMAANAEKVAEYRSGKDKLFGFFVGAAMKASQGQSSAVK
ncbi:MAG: Asp-tRNA(Asn)/Glu-tRNA(Gln) amidotransferase GatCAB subunit B, partial [Gallionella sp.]